MNPLALLTILFEDHAHASEAYRTHLDKVVVSIEQQTGMTSLHVGAPDHGLEDDYDRLARRMHACNTNLIFLDHILEFESRLGAFCRQVWRTFCKLRLEQGLEDLLQYQHDEFEQALDYHLNDSSLRRSQSQALQKRIQSQMSVV